MPQDLWFFMSLVQNAEYIISDKTVSAITPSWIDILTETFRLIPSHIVVDAKNTNVQKIVGDRGPECISYRKPFLRRKIESSSISATFEETIGIAHRILITVGHDTYDYLKDIAKVYSYIIKEIPCGSTLIFYEKECYRSYTRYVVYVDKVQVSHDSGEKHGI